MGNVFEITRVYGFNIICTRVTHIENRGRELKSDFCFSTGLSGFQQSTNHFAICIMKSLPYPRYSSIKLIDKDFNVRVIIKNI